MPHYTESQITAANQTDLVAFLMSRGEKLKPCGNQYLWERHQVWIHGYEWYTHYDSKGGYAVSFVMRYYGLTFQNAIAELLGDSVSEILPPKYQPKPIKVLTLPQPNATMNHVYAYLMEKRFIARDVITHFAKSKTLYEDAQYHNCIFLGLDEEGIPKHCHRRATGSSFKCTEAGSQAEYSFHHDGESEWLFVFEAPVDMLAFITLHQKDWQKHSYVALCSVSERAILHRLQVNPKLIKIVLCLDNDNAGISACHRIKEILKDKGYTNVRMLHSINKDWDEDVKAMNGISPIPAEADETEAIRKLCAEAIEEASCTKQPPMLFRKTCDTYTALINAHEYNRKQQIEHFLGLLLLLAKDECRKSLEPIEWKDLEAELVKTYVAHADNGDTQTRLRQLDTDMKAVQAVYDTPQLICDRNLFLRPILKVCMDCIRLLNYLGKEKNNHV